MKKLVMMLVVMAMAAPLMAGDVQFTATTDGLTVTVGYVATGGTIRGMALNVDTDVNIDAVAVDSFFDVFMDSAYMDPGTYTLGAGTPIASQDVAGEIALPSNMFCISMGNLEGVATADEFTLTAAAAGTGELAINTLRGAIVDTDGVEMTSNLPIPLTFETGVVSCYGNLPAADQAEVDLYVAASRDIALLDCWCNQFQCAGDTDNATETFFKYQVYILDLNSIVANWKLKVDTVDPCSDVAHDGETFFKYRCYINDLNLVVANWKLKSIANGGTLTDCPGYVAP